MTRQFFVPGQPQGKGRPKFARRGNFVKTYTPDKTASYESLIKAQYYAAHANAPLMGGELSVIIMAQFCIPKGKSARLTAAMLKGDTNPTKKPDADNIAKVVCDSLNGIAYNDDAQIVYLTVSKCYSDKPGIDVSIVEQAQEGRG